jgi:SAM-dependent methyltransferase
MHAAVEQLHRALRPGGILLLTVPGISQIDRGEWGASWYWALTPAAVQRLLGDVFGSELVAVESHGNVFAATTFLQGLAVEEIDVRRLAPHDPAYPVIVTARALKLPVDPQPTVPTPSPIRP